MVNETFPIIYQNERFLVDPELLSCNSQRFQYLMIQNQRNFQNGCVKITYNFFTTRNVANFLKICQNQMTDVQNSELKEICLLAKMFQAEEIYNKAYTYIRNEIDDVYFIPSDQLKEISENQNLIFEVEVSEEPQAFHCDLNELEFDDSYDEPESKDNNNISNDCNNHIKSASICYQIKIENPWLKCHRFYLLKDNRVIYSAKQKYDEIQFAEGENCHFKNNKQINDAKMVRDYKGFNVVSLHNGQEFKINYLKDGEKFLVKTEFNHQLGKQVWRPKSANCDGLLKGEFNHKVLKSRRNIILQNPQHHPTFILRKTTKRIFEAECSQNADPIIIFAIAISEIIGPIAM